jgi:hypothetical protein
MRAKGKERERGKRDMIHRSPPHVIKTLSIFQIGPVTVLVTLQHQIDQFLHPLAHRFARGV